MILNTVHGPSLPFDTRPSSNSGCSLELQTTVFLNASYQPGYALTTVFAYRSDCATVVWFNPRETMAV